MSEKDSTAKILKLHKQERKLLVKHLNFSTVLANSVIEGDFCRKACPQKRIHGKSFDWDKHCGCYLGERGCDALRKYDDFYRELKDMDG